MDRSTPQPQTVAAAKQRFLALSGQKKDYLAPIKKNPTASVGVAFAAGMLLQGVVRKGGLPPSLFSIGLQLLKKL